MLDLVGLQAYAYDVIDEGPEAVFRGVQLSGADTLLLCVSYFDHITTTDATRAPGLIRNRVRRSHADEAFLVGDPAAYPSDCVPPKGDPSLDGGLAFDRASALAKAKGFKVVPWVLGLSQRLSESRPDLCVVDVNGDIVYPWLCPSNPKTCEFLVAHIREVVRATRSTAVFLDGMRFPEPSAGSLNRFLACFCTSCETAAAKSGLKLRDVQTALQARIRAFEASPDSAVANQLWHRPFQALVAAAAEPELLQWFRFRQDAVTSIIAAIHSHLDGRASLWLDIWPPSYGWLLGQDPKRLGQYCEWIRPFTYHQWGGGADIPGILESISSDRRVQEEAYRSFLEFFGFSGPTTLKQFLARGLPASFITQETALLADWIHGRSRVASGPALWGLRKSAVVEALDQALLGTDEGLIMHCYGWATDDQLEVAGGWVGRHRMPHG